MNTSTENRPTRSSPPMAWWPPISRVAVKPIRIATRIRGTNAELSRMAASLAAMYARESASTRAASRFSAVNALMVVMPPRLLARVPDSTPTCSRTRA